MVKKSNEEVHTVKKLFVIVLMFSIMLCGCGGTTYNITGDNNSVGNEKNVNGVSVEVPNDIDVNSNNSEQSNESKDVNNPSSSDYEETYSKTDNSIDKEDSVETTEATETTEPTDDQDQKVTPFITSTPKSDAVIHADLFNWSEDDRDIFNNNYTGSNTFKLSEYNMINAMGGGAEDIIAEIHFPLGENFDDTWVINFVVMQDMLGNGSYAKVTILSDEEELYPAFTIESDTTDQNEYEVNLSGIRDLVIRFECHAVDSGFCGGIIIEDKLKE